MFEAVQNLNTLIDFRYTQHFRGKKGGNGSGSDRTGAGAPTVHIKVPVGTQIFDDDQETMLADLDVPGKKAIMDGGGEAIKLSPEEDAKFRKIGAQVAACALCA